MKVLVGGFRGKTNPSKLIIDKITCKHTLEKLYLVNSFEVSKKQLEGLLQKQSYDWILIFGQKPEVKSIYLEQQACINGHKLTAGHNYAGLEKLLNYSGFTVKLSNNAGNYLCNHIFYIGLKHIEDNNLNTRMIFIHIPGIKNIENIDGLAHVFSTYIDELTPANI
jgi:pyroglutamyl-peptidase